MAQAKQGDTVKVHFTGKLSDGTVFDTSEGKDPIQFTLGSGQVIEGFDESITGMNVGDSKTINIPQEKAYGERRDELMLEVDRKHLPDNIDPGKGERLEMEDPNGRKIRVTVTDKTDQKLILDANPPLAGQDLIFDIELVEIV